MKTEFNVFSVWLHFLALCFTVIFFTRLFGILLPIAIPKIAQYVLPSCRARCKAAKLRAQELKELRVKMGQLNMVDNFSAYSKLQRKVKSLEKEQNEANRNQLGATLVSSLLAQVIRFVLHAILIAWLFSHTPTDRLTDDQLALFKETRAFIGWLVFCVHYIPAWFCTFLWISLCEITSNRFLMVFQRKIEGYVDENLFQNAASFTPEPCNF